MKPMSAVALLATASLAMAGTALAQSSSVQAKVPFDFTVGDKVLPAGTYTIKPNSAYVIMIRNHDQPVASVSLVHPDSRTSPKDGTLVFHKYGGRYFLSEIFCDSANMNVELPVSKREKTAHLQQASVGTSSNILIAAR